LAIAEGLAKEDVNGITIVTDEKRQVAEGRS
jgi:hypothetical protein